LTPCPGAKKRSRCSDVSACGSMRVAVSLTVSLAVSLAVSMAVAVALAVAVSLAVAVAVPVPQPSGCCGWRRTRNGSTQCLRAGRPGSESQRINRKILPHCHCHTATVKLSNCQMCQAATVPKLPVSNCHSHCQTVKLSKTGTTTCAKCRDAHMLIVRMLNCQLRHCHTVPLCHCHCATVTVPLPLCNFHCHCATVPLCHCHKKINILKKLVTFSYIFHQKKNQFFQALKTPISGPNR
jgi:hypothetical protein